MSQSELARKIWGTTKDARGYVVAKNRDRISAYENGKSEPSRENLDALASALNTTVEELAPDIVASKIGAEQPSIAMTMIKDQADRVHLQVNTITSLSLASQVIALLSKEK